MNDFSLETFNGFERSPIAVDEDRSNSYYISKYWMRFPHEHDINPANSTQEIAERYARRFQRLRASCRSAQHVVFLRTNAVRTYDLSPEAETEYSTSVMAKAERSLGELVGHDRFTLAFFTERLELKEITFPFMASAELRIPFENCFYEADVNRPLNAEALGLFSTWLSPLRKAKSTKDVQDIISGFPTRKPGNRVWAQRFLRRIIST